MTTTPWTGHSVNLRNPSIATLSERSTAGMRQDGDYARLLLHVASRVSSAAPLDEILTEVAEFACGAAKFESCGILVAEGDHLIPRAAQSYHAEALHRVKIQTLLDATGWVAGQTALVAVPQNAWTDPRVKIFFNNPVEDRFEGFLAIPMVSGGRLVGTINLIDRAGQAPDERAVAFIATMGILAGAEIERVRLAGENTQLADRLEARKIVERAKGILQRNLNMSEEDAYLTLQRESRQRRKSMKEVAEAIVLSEDLKKKK
jgi:uroporphyrinogen-III synthase